MHCAVIALHLSWLNNVQKVHACSMKHGQLSIVVHVAEHELDHSDVLMVNMLQHEAASKGHGTSESVSASPKERFLPPSALLPSWDVAQQRAFRISGCASASADFVQQLSLRCNQLVRLCMLPLSCSVGKDACRLFMVQCGTAARAGRRG